MYFLIILGLLASPVKMKARCVDQQTAVCIAEAKDALSRLRRGRGNDPVGDVYQFESAMRCYSFPLKQTDIGVDETRAAAFLQNARMRFMVDAIVQLRKGAKYNYDDLIAKLRMVSAESVNSLAEIGVTNADIEKYRRLGCKATADDLEYRASLERRDKQRAALLKRAKSERACRSKELVAND